MQEVILFYKGLEVPTRQILDSKGAKPTMTVTDAKVAIQEVAEHSQKWHDKMSTRTRSTETSDGLAVIQAQLNLGREIKKVNKKMVAASGFYQRNHANPSYQERRQSMEESLRKFITESTKRHEENYNLIKDIRASTDAAIRNHRASIKTLEIQIGRLYDYHCDKEEGSYGLKDLDAYSIGTTLHNDALPQKKKDLGSFTLPCYIDNVCFEKSLADLGASVIVMPFLTYTNLGLGKLAHTKLTVELANRTVKHPKGIVENVLVGIGKFVFPVDFIILDMPEDVKVPLILGRPFLSTTHAKIYVFKRKITLREARLMGETLTLNRSLDPLYGDYIKLNDLNEPLELRTNQVDDLKPTIEEGEVVDKLMIDVVKTRNDNNMVNKFIDNPRFMLLLIGRSY
ncbi:ribonuclease H-like domain, reverse transcriptase, RNA-dependent DNA polymerase [Tanacetum coccineum]